MKFNCQNNSPDTVGLLVATTTLLCGSLWVSPVLAGQWDISPRVAVEESYTDNVFGDADAKSDFFTKTSAGIGVVGDGNRVDLTLGYDISRDFYVKHSELDDFQHNMLGSGKVELWEDHIFLDASAAISQELLSRNSGSRSATDRSLNNNQTQVLNYSISPSFVHGNDGWADSVLSYRISQVRNFNTDQGTGSDAANNSTTYEINSFLESGRRFTQFLWKLSGTTSITREDDGEDSREQNTELSGEYVVNRHVSILGRVGYEEREDSGFDDDENTGITWRGGVRVQPGPRTTARLEYGHRFGGGTLSGDLTYKVGPRTTLTATYEEDIETQQQSQNSNLVNVLRLPDGTLVDRNTGLPADPNDPRFNFDDDSFKSQSFSLGLSGTRGRNTFNVSGFHETREFGTGGRTETNWGLGASLNRRLSPSMSAGVAANFSNDSGGGTSGGGEEQTLDANAFVGYNFSQTLTGSLNYNFSNTNEEGKNNDITENIVSVSLNKSF